MVKRPAYQQEPHELREPVWDAGCFSALQMMRVAAWKSARGLAPLTMNDEDDIAQRTAAALDAIASWRTTNVLQGDVDWNAWQSAVATAIGSKRDGTGLLGLQGFGYPMASAFLAFLAPQAFPVIDRWTVLAVYGPNARDYERSRVFAHFAAELVEHAGDFSVTSSIHAVDQAVMAAAMQCEHDDRPCACYPFWPAALPDRAGATASA